MLKSNIHFKFLLCFCFLITQRVQITKAQDISELKKAFSENSNQLLDKFILKSQYFRNEKIKNDTSTNLSGLINSFVNDYSRGFKLIPNDSLSRPGKEKYILLQPNIETCFVNALDSTNLFAISMKNRPTPLEWNLYPHKGVYSAFMSGGYYKFSDLADCKKRNYNIDRSGKGKHTALIADTGIVKTVNLLLKSRGAEHVKEVNFLRAFIKLIPSRRFEGKSALHYANYNFFIDRVIFDKSMQKAFIQFSFTTHSWEALYYKIHGKWVQGGIAIVMRQ